MEIDKWRVIIPRKFLKKVLKTMINMAFCWLILVGTAIQKLVFGELRVSEQQHLKDKFWNFVFYKFIFVFGIINVQYIDEVLLWCSWFSLLGFLHLLSQLSKDRFEYLSFSPTTPLWSHVKLLFLLTAIFTLSGFMLLVSVFVGFFGGFNTFAFMSAEVVLLSIRTLHVIIRYALHLYDMRQEGASSVSANEENRVWEKRGPIAYYTELSFELTALIIDFVHHLHMLVWSNIFLSMASLVICMQLRYLFHEIQRRYKKHRNYLWVRNHLEQNYPMASSEELADNSDNCAICWEKMESARKLPCTHLFHNTCLLSWLEQDTSCPTCRLALNIQTPSTSRIDPPDLQVDAPQPQRRQLNHFFHFDGSRYVSWLPSFSVEVSHAQLMRQDNAPASNSQLDAMARQVQQLFPHIPISTIINDLRVTRSVEITIENVLDGRLVAPTMYREPEVVPATNRAMSVWQASCDTDSQRNWDEFSVETVETEDTSSLGSRFSKSSSEREKILHRRKENLIQSARKRYIEKQKAAAAAKVELQS
ncbi:E3 ubiquitin-protein ligase AMFR isoform X2 [Tribolium castaneum]|uniref:E3 ubiquitin-protein ligase AMFR isoform X2 n=1 Tax=Tribolium castaneum TaxID=7070 RepID=UPI00077DC54E|nr:PREDICTED: E3 ubiquitin-protein ligase AMFR isoform X2 [Tribolium castaneum]|eukprot:XP_015837138.1 PREDICTED: E3 ubiquitin-protein ligase AMFR isoform X2 [Tribolium castaneum]